MRRNNTPTSFDDSRSKRSGSGITKYGIEEVDSLVKGKGFNVNINKTLSDQLSIKLIELLC